MSSVRNIGFVGALALGLAACGSAETSELDAIDAKVGGKAEADPALTAALEDQIMVDPSLSGQANDDAIKPAKEPMQTPIPAGEGAPAAASPGQTLGGLAAEQAEISKTIVELHGGTVRAEGEPGKGSTFIIDLPVTRSNP